MKNFLPGNNVYRSISSRRCTFNTLINLEW